MDETFRDDLIFVGGTWQKGRGAPIQSHFAAEGALNTTISGASSADVDDAIACALAEQPAWAALRPHERATYLYRISDGIAASIERIACVQSCDTSKTLTETRALAASAAGTFRYFAAVLETSDDLLTVPGATTGRRRPMNHWAWSRPSPPGIRPLPPTPRRSRLPWRQAMLSF